MRTNSLLRACRARHGVWAGRAPHPWRIPVTLLAALDARPVTRVVAPHRAIVTRAFATVATSVPQARRWVRSQLRRRGVGPDDCHRVELLISEAAGNTVRHARSDTFAIRLDL